MRGRADDMIKVSRHRIGTAELESAAASHPLVVEAVTVGKPDDLKGEKIAICNSSKGQLSTVCGNEIPRRLLFQACVLMISAFRR
jgi:acyl-coenzyme A synthetase/AMP-(fatty) acid ligase